MLRGNAFHLTLIQEPYAIHYEELLSFSHILLMQITRLSLRATERFRDPYLQQDGSIDLNLSPLLWLW